MKQSCVDDEMTQPSEHDCGICTKARVSESGACDRLSTVHKPSFQTFPPSSVPPPWPPTTTRLRRLNPLTFQ